MNAEHRESVNKLRNAILFWLDSEGPTRRGVARSTLAAGLVIIDMLRRDAPLTDDIVFTDGGQVCGSRGKALKDTLERYGIPRDYLRDGSTTRSTARYQRLLTQIDYGRDIAQVPEDERDAIVDELVKPILEVVQQQLRAEKLVVPCDIRESPVAWIETILAAARDRSFGRVEQHLVGAKLEKRFPGQLAGSHAAFAADRQTSRYGDFQIRNTVYHVTAMPTLAVIEKCGENLAAGLRPALIVPRARVEGARVLAEAQGIRDQTLIFSMEDFLAQNIIEMADVSQEDHLEQLKAVIEIYNARVEQAETGVSLRIEIR